MLVRIAELTTDKKFVHFDRLIFAGKSNLFSSFHLMLKPKSHPGLQHDAATSQLLAGETQQESTRVTGMATTPGSSYPDSEESNSSTNEPVSRLARVPWVDAFSLCLVLPILTFYALVIATGLELFRAINSLLTGPWQVSFGSSLRMGAIFVVVAVVFQLSRLLVRGLRGLVTSEYDDNTEKNLGILLQPSDHPELYEIVSSVAQQTDAPMPDEIRITHQAECSVVELRKFAIRTQRRLVLVLGLPHLAVMSVTELKIILAHELAHFRSGDTTLGVFIYRFLETLRETQEAYRCHWSYRLNPLYWYCKIYFLAFLHLSSPIRRQQEFRADCISAEIFGSELATRTLLTEWLVAHQFEDSVNSFHHAVEGNVQSTKENVFRWFTSHWHRFSAEGQDYLRQRLAEEEHSSLLDSHPTIAARIEAMGGFECRVNVDTRPAQELVRNFSVLQERLHPRIFSDVMSA